MRWLPKYYLDAGAAATSHCCRRVRDRQSSEPPRIPDAERARARGRLCVLPRSSPPSSTSSQNLFHNPETRDTSGSIVVMGLYPLYRRLANFSPLAVAGDDVFISGQSVYVSTPALCSSCARPLTVSPGSNRCPRSRAAQSPSMLPTTSIPDSRRRPTSPFFPPLPA